MFKTHYIIFVAKHNGDPLGFISLLTKNCLPKKAVLLLAISP